MPRPPLVRSNTLPYHVTARGNNRERFPVPLRVLWSLIQYECWTLDLTFGAEIHALVLMPNHFHMILTAPEHDLGKLMNIFMSNLTKRGNRSIARSGHLFGGPHHRSLIKSSRYFGHALKYVYRNPVRAQLCERVEDYEFSTLYGLQGNGHLGFPIEFTRIGMEAGLPIHNSEEFLSWLNRPFPKESEQLVRKGLTLKVFDELKCRAENRPYEKLNNLL